MERFEPSSRIGNGNGGDRAKFLLLKLGMEEFEPSSKSEIERFETSLKLGIGNGGG